MLRRILRRLVVAFGLLFLAAGALIFVGELLAWLRGDDFVLRSLGRIWFDQDPGSLNLLQAVVERYLWPPLWWQGVQPLLEQPAAPLLAGFGLVLLLLTRLRLRRRAK
jgi:hypothetical protein